MIGEGEFAPDFEVLDHNGKRIRLSDFTGKRNVVLYFYPWDDTPGCTTEACSFRDNMEGLRKYDVEILGVSTNDIPSHQAFAHKYNLLFSLLPDPEKKIGTLYGVPIRTSQSYGEIYKRVTFLIDKRGKIAKVFPEVDVTVHTGQVEDILAKLP